MLKLEICVQLTGRKKVPKFFALMLHDMTENIAVLTTISNGPAELKNITHLFKTMHIVEAMDMDSFSKLNIF